MTEAPPPRPSHRERRMAHEGSSYKWGALLHLSALSWYLGLPLGLVIGPLVFWLWKRHESPFIDRAGMEALNFQLSVLLYSFVLGLMSDYMGLLFLPMPLAGVGLFGPIGLVFQALWLLLILASIVLTVTAGVHATQGEQFVYPGAIRFFQPERAPRRSRKSGENGGRDSDLSCRDRVCRSRRCPRSPGPRSESGSPIARQRGSATGPAGRSSAGSPSDRRRAWGRDAGTRVRG